MSNKEMERYYLLLMDIFEANIALFDNFITNYFQYFGTEYIYYRAIHQFC